MNQYWLMFFAAILIGEAFLVHRIDNAFFAEGQKDQLIAQVEVNKKAQAETNATVGKTNAALSHFNETAETLKEKYNAPISSPCVIPNGKLQLLRDTAKAANLAAK
jgi:hypothetical protein